ncbi:hypothetical protein B4U79_14585 [Dinothrombium tinctorium]|uniref:Uncharacterized protein n=1 Tax=Dinothrombium tinctorium TaxID=1965070 RepID=A0A3S3P8V1_9ACAR|nr:hypothetical protein B4U79_12532 [Dinothrombium tinctorium]RWS17465.1 hypothetical protein B4U79_14585 [Dinothrombium tinctorium]
MPFTSRRLCQE